MWEPEAPSPMRGVLVGPVPHLPRWRLRVQVGGLGRYGYSNTPNSYFLGKIGTERPMGRQVWPPGVLELLPVASVFSTCERRVGAGVDRRDLVLLADTCKESAIDQYIY